MEAIRSIKHQGSYVFFDDIIFKSPIFKMTIKSVVKGDCNIIYKLIKFSLSICMVDEF